MNYDRVILDAIEREKSGLDYIYSCEDLDILHGLLDEINNICQTNFKYLAELDFFNITGSGKIIAKYIEKFSSETIKAMLIPQIVLDKVDDYEQLILNLYLKFKDSKDYISPKGIAAPSHIYVRYDNAFRKFKSKKILDKLLKIVMNPRDAFYLPLTTKMLSSKKDIALKEKLIFYLNEANITENSIGIENEGTYYPSLLFIRRELKFLSIYGLRYYPEDDVILILEKLLYSTDEDIVVATKKSLSYIQKNKI